MPFTISHNAQIDIVVSQYHDSHTLARNGSRSAGPGCKSADINPGFRNGWADLERRSTDAASLLEWVTMLFVIVGALA
jgi:hypothetical protein